MKKFEAPEIEIILLSVQDILTTSNGGSGGEDELPPVECW